MKILLFDIENSPNLGYVWQKYEQDVIDFKQEWYMLSFAYKWLGEKQTKAYGLPDFKAWKKDKTDDGELVLKLHELLSEADVVVGHNAKRFDTRKSNARFLANGLTPPEPYKVVDTLTIARKYFHLNSNKLNDLGKALKIGQKVETGGFALWLACMEGDEKAWKRMLKYNKRDVELLEKVYLKLLPWDTGHPNRNIFTEENGCPNCGSEDIQKRGFHFSRVSRRQRYQCKGCGAWSQGEIIKTNTIIR